MNDLRTGFRFHPTEEELLGFYLKNKLENRREDMERVIPVADIYSFDPWQLPRQRLVSQISGDLCDRESGPWFFFCPRQEREAHGGRPTRTTPSGYWKATGSPSLVYSMSSNRVMGVKKAMVFYQGRAPNGTKTKWKMNEYRALQEDATTLSSETPKLRNEFRVCRVYMNSCILRSFDRRPSVTRNSENHRIMPEAASSSTENQPMTEGTSSHASSSAGDHGPHRSDEGGETIDWSVFLGSLDSD